MLPSGLVGAIDTLRERIARHRPALSQSEALTRYALIDPLLRELGWDTANPDLVTPEYTVSGKRADYALLESGNVVVFLEAKRLEENLSNHRSQVVAYASELGIRYPALTNGNDWEVYDNSQLVPIDQRRILAVSLTGAPPPVNALQLLLLWRPNLSSGEPVPAKEPIVAPVADVPTPLPVVVDTLQIIEKYTAPVASEQAGDGNRVSSGSRRRWVHPDRPNNLLNLGEVYQQVKTVESEGEVSKALARLNNGEITRSAYYGIESQIRMNAAQAGGYIRLTSQDQE